MSSRGALAFFQTYTKHFTQAFDQRRPGFMLRARGDPDLGQPLPSDLGPTFGGPTFGGNPLVVFVSKHGRATSYWPGHGTD